MMLFQKRLESVKFWPGGGLKKGGFQIPCGSYCIKLTIKKHFLLLEVLIAFVLIALCMIPLISPQTFILTQQKKFIQELEVNHVVNLAYADIIERLYKNEIPWNSIIQGNEFEVDETMLQRLKYSKKIPYRGYYAFSEIIHKPTEDTPRKLYLFNLNFQFVPQVQGSGSKSQEPLIPGTLKFHYEVFVIRDIGTPGTPQSETNEGENPRSERQEGGRPTP